MLDRVGDPQLSPDGKRAVFQQRETKYEANAAGHGIWIVELESAGDSLRRLTAENIDAASPRWSPDGRSVFYLAEGGGTMQLWEQDVYADSQPRQRTRLPLDVGSYRLSPSGKQALVSLDVYPDCNDLNCTRRRLDSKTSGSSGTGSGTLYRQIFVRHWDTWSDGRRSRLFIVDIAGDIDGADPKLLSRDIDGDIPSKPYGDDSEYAFSADGNTVYFNLRIAGSTEPRSTNFDIYQVPSSGSSPPKNVTSQNLAWDGFPLAGHDGTTLYYLATKRPGFEADRFRIMAFDTVTGKTREVDPDWDRTPGPMQLSKDGKTLFTTADEDGNHKLFSVDTASGAVRKLTEFGEVEAFSVVGDDIVFTRSTLTSPADLFHLSIGTGAVTQITHQNATRLAALQMGDYESYTFKGADDATVQGFVVKPVGFEQGKKYPVAFVIHGGPQWAFRNAFDYRWNPQTYAGQGFAVVAVNFHGSTGYGQAFTDSISGNWGRQPLVDLQRGWAAALEKFPFLDGERACALGASYGGYMVYWIAGNWNQPWKCLVGHDGIFDNRMMGYTTDELWFHEWENGGSPWEFPKNYELYNPVAYVKDWRVPMLVIHSANDFRVPQEQGLAAFTALQRRNIPSEFLSFPDENHWILKPQNSVQWHEVVNDWLKKWTALH